MANIEKQLVIPLVCAGGVSPCNHGEYVGVFMTNQNGDPFVMSVASHVSKEDAVEDARQECVQGNWNLDAGRISAYLVITDEEFDALLPDDEHWEVVDLLGLRRVN